MTQRARSASPFLPASAPGPVPEPADVFSLAWRARYRDLWHSLMWGGGLTHYSLHLTAERLYLRSARPSDYGSWATLRRFSRRFLQPWEPLWPADDLTRGAFLRRIRRDARDWNDGLGFAFLIFRQDDDTLVGGITLSNIRRGVAQCGTIGYWMGEAHAGQGLMTEALARLVTFAFGRLDLHRLEAVCLPSNVPSRRVLRMNGFHYEGRVLSYLKINGRWQDHDMFGLIRPAPGREELDPSPPSV